ncbi:hypothetical protein FF1_021645 [Malus domestica]
MEMIIDDQDLVGNVRGEAEMELKWGLDFEERKFLVWLRLQVAQDVAPGDWREWSFLRKKMRETRENESQIPEHARQSEGFIIEY